MNRKSNFQILDNAARDRLAEHTDLAPRILTQIQERKGSKMKLRMKVIATAFLILLVFAIVLINVPSVRAAIRRWIGYIPGIGLVSEGQIRVMAEPVSITREGITLKVEQVLVDSNQTTVIYSVEGLALDMLDTNQGVNAPGCYKEAVLGFGKDEFTITNQVGTSWMTGYRHRASYPVIPPKVGDVTLRVPCLHSALPGKTPENWELSFRLVPAPVDMTAFPVIEIPTSAQATATILPAKNTAAPLSTDGISITLDRAVQLDDGYLIYATLHWENTNFIGLDVLDPSVPHLLDANLKEVPYTLDIDAMTSVTPERGQTVLAIRTAPIQTPGPLTLVVDQVLVTVTTDGSFIFDPGTNPKPGQVWEFTQDVALANGRSLQVLKATYPTPPVEGLPQQAGFSFDMKSDTGVTGARLFDKAHPLAGGGGGGGGSPSDIFKSGFSYAGAMPEGPITVNVESISTSLSGHWEAQWTPPATQPDPTPQPSACLTSESWQQALQQQASLPTGLTGKLARFMLEPPTFFYTASVVNLDGSNSKPLGLGSMPSLSPDGTRVVYMGPSQNKPADGLYITELVSGNITLLPGTAKGDMNPLWSPTGTKIAFTRGPSSGLIGAPGPYVVIVTDVDGSNFRQLTKGSEASYAAAWMPDGNRLLYTVVSQNEVSLHMLDIQTGETSSLFDKNYNGSVVVSPDGNRLAFEEMLPLDKYGLFVSSLDGSNRKLLANGDPYIVTIPYWSPDGQWVIASVHDPETNKHPNPTLALIKVDNCKIIALSNLGGYVSSWLP